MWSFFKRKAPEIPAKNRPAMPAETAAAVTQLNLAHRFLMKAWQDREYTDQAMRSLTMASKAVNEARAADPLAHIAVEQNGEPTRYTVDELAAHILFSQGELLLYGGKLLMEHFSDQSLSVEAIKDNRDKIGRYNRDAFTAAEAALRYQPQNVKYRLLLAKAYRALGKKKDAKRVLDELLKIDPHNLDAHELKAELG